MRTLASLALLAACSTSADAVREGMTDGGTYHVTASPDGEVLAAVDMTFEIAVHDVAADAPATGATVAVTPWMPSMGHGIPDTPPVVEIGDGLYETTFQFSMAGAWEVEVEVDGETVTFAWDVR